MTNEEENGTRGAGARQEIADRIRALMADGMSPGRARDAVYADAQRASMLDSDPRALVTITDAIERETHGDETAQEWEARQMHEASARAATLPAPQHYSDPADDEDGLSIRRTR